MLHSGWYALNCNVNMLACKYVCFLNGNIYTSNISPIFTVKNMQLWLGKFKNDLQRISFEVYLWRMFVWTLFG